MSRVWQQRKEAFNPKLNRFRGRLGLRSLTLLFRRRLAVFFAVSTAVVLATVTIVQTSQPRFRADAEVLLDGPSVARETARLLSSDMARAVSARLQGADKKTLTPRDGLMRWLRSRLWTSEQPPGNYDPNLAIIDGLRRHVSITHAPETLSLTISYSATDAAVAANVANAYAAAYTGSRPSPRVPSERIISSAAIPLSSTSPGVAYTLLIGLVLGSLLGLVAAIVTELRFAGLTTGADVQNRLWIRHIGSVPELATVLSDAPSVLDAVVDQPRSGFTESFRKVILAARGGGADRVQVIAVACSLPGEGATTVAMALARTLALGRQSVVLVDCDARRRISRMFGVEAASAGLSDVLAGRATLDDVLFDDAVSGAQILPQATSPADLPSSGTRPAMRELVQQLRSRFDVVLVANGRLTVGADDRWLADITDAVLLVTRWRSTPDTAVAAIVEHLRHHHAEVAGVVLNRVDMRRQIRYTDDEASVYQQQFSKYFS